MPVGLNKRLGWWLQTTRFVEGLLAMRNWSRFRLAGLLVLVASLALAAGGLAAVGSRQHRVFRGKRSVLSAAEIRRLSAGAKRREIIIFKDQLTGVPARRRTARARASAARASQAAVRTELARVHATHVRGYQIINAIS